MNEDTIKKFEDGRKVAYVAGGLVYLGVVLLFVSFYETLMAGRFDGFLGVIARIGAFLVAANSIALPLALHFWTVTGWHRAVGILFYAGDIILMSLNVIASAATPETAPEWVVNWINYSPASIIFVLIGWAVLFMFDPGQQAIVSLQEVITQAKVDIVNSIRAYVKSPEGKREIVQPYASAMATNVLSEQNLLGVAPALVIGRKNPPVEETSTGDIPTGGEVVEALTRVLESAGANGNSRELAESIIRDISNPTNASIRS